MLNLFGETYNSLYVLRCKSGIRPIAILEEHMPEQAGHQRGQTCRAATGVNHCNIP